MPRRSFLHRDSALMQSGHMPGPVDARDREKLVEKFIAKEGRAPSQEELNQAIDRAWENRKASAAVHMVEVLGLDQFPTPGTKALRYCQGQLDRALAQKPITPLLKVA